MKMKDLKKQKCYTRLRKKKQFVSWTIFLLFAISFSSSVDAQQLTREQVMNTIYTMPAFSMYQDNYMISGIPLHRDIGSETADVKYQISFKHLLTRRVLPLDSYLFLTYTQTAFWNLYTFSSPFHGHGETLMSYNQMRSMRKLNSSDLKTKPTRIKPPPQRF